MAYIHFTKSPGVSLADYNAVGRELGDDPIKGRRSHFAGEVGGALHTVDIWETREDADRFAADRLFPAFERARVRPGADATVIGFDAEADDE